MFKIAPAIRENVKLKIGMSGPSGAGKTYSALQLALGIAGSWEKVAVADTENKSALYYSGMGPWQHIPVDPDEMEGGYHPRNFIKLIEFAEKQGLEVLIIDSISHEWEGRGGCLDLVDQIGKGFASWKTVTPLHNAFMDAMRHSSLHIIATMRSKQDYVVEENAKGKAQPKKVGLKSIQREGADYDFGIVFDVDMNHFARSSKDRTGIYMPRGEFKMTQAVGKELVEWATSGIEAPAPSPRVVPEDRGEPLDPTNKTHKEGLWKRLKERGFGPEDGVEIFSRMNGKYPDEFEDVVAEYLEKASRL